jgi:hypothetical protein
MGGEVIREERGDEYYQDMTTGKVYVLKFIARDPSGLAWSMYYFRGVEDPEERLKIRTDDVNKWAQMRLLTAMEAIAWVSV